MSEYRPGGFYYRCDKDGRLPTTICWECSAQRKRAVTFIGSCPVNPPGCDCGCNSCWTEIASGMLNITGFQPMPGTSGLGGGGWSLSLSYAGGGSGSPGVNGMGPGFDFTQNSSVNVAGETIILNTGQNTQETFYSTSGGYSSATNNTQSRLSMSGVGQDEKYLLRSSNGTKSEFWGTDSSISTPGMLKSVTDRYGNQQKMDWERNNGIYELKQVTDSYGKKINYKYGSPLQSVTDSYGRTTSFQYDEQDRLVAVVGPSILRTPGIATDAPGSDDKGGFPGGTGYVYQYDSANPRPERRNDMIKAWFPNQVAPYIDPVTRKVDIAKVYADAQPRNIFEYGQNPGDADSYGKIVREVGGDPNGGPGGVTTYQYTTSNLPESIFSDECNQIVSQTTVTDRNGNITIYGFNFSKMPVRTEVLNNRQKSSLEASSFITWRKYNTHNQEELVIFPEGNSIEREFDDGVIPGFEEPYAPRIGLLLRETQFAGNDYGIPSRPGSNGQTQLTSLYFYEPLFNQLCAMVERRGNPIDDEGNFFAPQNGGATPTPEDRSRYATVTYYDYQKNTYASVVTNEELQDQLDLTQEQLEALIDYVNDDMIAMGLPAGFEMDLGDINGDGTGNGDSSGKPAAKILGNRVKVKHPRVRLVGGTWQDRLEIWTVNDRGQDTTHTDPNGNLTVWVRYPENDPEGDGQFVSETLSGQQYGLIKEIHQDANPDDVMTLVGAEGDLVDFVSGIIPRTNTPGVYQDLVTRHSAQSGCGCSACSYDAMGNMLSQTDPRGFTTTFDRDELGRVYRETSPAPYFYKKEFFFDANGNVIRVDVEDQQVDYQSDDPTDALYAKFIPSGNAYPGASGGGVAHVPSKPGKGGKIRPGWFVNKATYDLLDQKVEDDVDATGSDPSRLISHYAYDPNGNLIKLTKPEGNTVEYDYDERNMRIAQRVGYVPPAPGEGDPQEPGSVTVFGYDKNGNPTDVIAPCDRDGSTANNLTATINDAFRSGNSLTHTGDWATQNTYDGFDRQVEAKDACGGVSQSTFDPDGRPIESAGNGTIGGASPTNRTGSGNALLVNGIARYDEAGRQYESQGEVFLPTGITLPSGRTVTQTGGGLTANSNANDHVGTVTLTTGGESYILTRTIYDAGGRGVQTIADNTALTLMEYDGANRPIKSIDPLGNISERGYDANGNAITVKSIQKCTIEPGEGAPEIADEIFIGSMRYDCLNRMILSASQGADGKFSSDTINTASSTVYALVGYDSRSNRALTIDPKGNTSEVIFDGASRAIETRQQMRMSGNGELPAAPNQTLDTTGERAGAIGTETVYDGNSRVVALIDDHGNSTTYLYDQQDRQVRMMFPDGSTRLSEYDPCGDVIQYTDENGNVWSYSYDALGRRALATVEKAEGVVGTTSQGFEYDGLSRQTLALNVVDSEMAMTSVFYDSLGRVLEESQELLEVALESTNNAFESVVPIEYTFPDGRVVQNGYDAMYRRRILSELSPAGTICEWDFFGPSRLAEWRLANGLSCTMMNNTRSHSAVQSTMPNPAWGDSTSDRLGYDGMGRMIAKRFISSVLDSEGAYSDTTPVVGFTTSFDRSGNKYYERMLHAENRSSLYQPYPWNDGIPGQPVWNGGPNVNAEPYEVNRSGIDSANRLRKYQRGTLAGPLYGYLPTGALPGTPGAGGFAVETPITLPGTDEERTYSLDHLGNWKKTAYTPVGETETLEVRQHNDLNQITSRKIGSDPAIPLVYDKSGNLLDDGERLMAYDALNRLVEVHRKSDDALIALYTYDASPSRRVLKTVTNGGLTGDIPNGVTRSLYAAGTWQVTEERAIGGETDSSSDSTESLPSDVAGVPTKQFLWGTYIDELIQLRMLEPAGPQELESGEYYPLQDLHYRTCCLTDNAGEIVEVYDYDAYGNTQIFTNSGMGGNWWANDSIETSWGACDILFCGYQFKFEIAFYNCRRRSYNPLLSIWTTRDTLLYEDGFNVYLYCGGNPVKWLDPYGTDRLVFDGKKLCRITDDGKKCLKCWKARSGKALRDAKGKLILDAKGLPMFPEPTIEEQKRMNEGPIPAGEWTLHSGRAKDPQDPGIWSRQDWNEYSKNKYFFQIWKTNTTPRGKDPWGEWFTRLTPGYEETKTETYGRDRFNIHGGAEWGSAGCIDLTCGDADFFGDILKDMGGKNVRLTVDYSGKSTPSDCKEPDECGNPWVAPSKD